MSLVSHVASKTFLSKIHFFFPSNPLQSPEKLVTYQIADWRMRIAEDQNSKYIQHQLGHASIQTTLDRYGHLMPDSNQEQAKGLGSRLGIAVQNKILLEDC